MFNVISFFLTINYALNVYLRLKDRLNRVQKLTLLHVRVQDTICLFIIHY